jgi:hypothetical protein
VFSVSIVLIIVGMSILNDIIVVDDQGMYIAGYVLLSLSISLLLVEGIPMWIVGAIFKNKYANTKTTSATK